MFLRLARFLLLAFLVTAFARPSHAQFAAAYSQAAQTYRNAAAQCTGAQQQCYLARANYYDCLVASLGPNGRSCTEPPTCSGSAASGASSQSSSDPISGIIPGPSAKAVEAQQLVNLGMNLLQMLSDRQAQKAAQAQQAQQDQQNALQQQKILAEERAEQLIKQEAQNLLADSADLLASANVPGSPTSNNALDSLFNATTSSPNSNSALDNLIDAATGPSNPSNALDNLVDATGGPADQSDGSIASLLGQPLPASLDPQDQEMNAAFQDSVNQPDPSQTGPLAQALQPDQQINDGLNGLVAPNSAPASSLTDDKIVEWRAGQDSAPLPTAGDSPEEAANKVFTQSIYGIRDLIDGLSRGYVGYAKSLYKQGVKMIDQITSDVGLAGDTNLETDQEISN